MKNRSDLILQTDKTKPGTGAGMSPPAQSSKLLQLATFLEYENNRIDSFLANNMYESEYLKAVICLMRDGGLRVSEVLGIKYHDILPGARVVIKGKKGSENRVVSGASYWLIWTKKKRGIVQFIQGLSRFYLYRICKRYGFYLKVEGTGNMKVTHYFRYLYLLSLRLSSLDSNDIKNAIGHRNIKSQNSYYDKNFKTNKL